ncbi:MAG: hypothetical protein QG625_4344 [Cyanobacteriota bacterium erpe_2018_sw_39hr_WHONDRS-SW48-000098_B_bin.30]|nr:hypothetical protein [Cyanobacteriota bacterium erpe_2018_sw_39hr_WHONDRS-SW48-000098_B_bin.30]
MLKESQVKNLWLGMVALAVMGCYPPWREFGSVSNPLGFSPIFEPPKLEAAAIARGVTRIDIDFSRLGIELFLGVAATISMVLTAGKTETKQPALSAVPNQAPASAPPKNNLPPLNTLTVELPGEHGLGDILVESEDDPDYWEPLCRAQGSFYLPKGKKLQLEIAKDRRVDLSLLKRIPTGLLFSIDASGSKITDEDAKKLSAVSGLKELDLSGTPISSTAVEALKNMGALEKLWLDNTLVDDNCVPSLIALNHLKKLSLEGTKLNALALESLKKDLPATTEIVV